MKILMLNYEYPPVGGGGATVTAQLCVHLVQQGHQVDVITMRYKNLPAEETVDGVRIFRFPSYRHRADICRTHEMATYLWGAWRPAVKLALRENYDVIHAHFIIPTSPLARHIKKHTRLPYLVTCHGSDVPGHNPQRFTIMHKTILPAWKKLVKDADKLVSPSRALKKLIQTHVPQANVEVIPNGAEPAAFDPSRPRKNNILLCSRILKFKGFQYVIQAVKDLSLDWQVHVVGDGPYLPPLKEAAQDSKTPIIFHGWLDRNDPQFRELYETGSIFVFPSEMENFPSVLLEAMSAGLAIITSTAGGCPEVVGDAALLVEPKNPEAIRTQLLALIESEQKRQSLSTAALNRLRRFSWDTVAKDYVDLYRQLTQNR
jgi:glycosyltransferase involved in cell wall biosynthesis